MHNFAELIGRVMMSAVMLPKNQNDNRDLTSYAEIEFKKHDRGFVVDSIGRNKN